MISRIFTFATLFLTVMFLAACASTQPVSSGTDTPTEVKTQAPEPEVIDDYEGDGMELTLDGSSIEAFDASMARIKRHTDEASYKSLDSAIGYLLVYDLEARGNKEILIGKLDGKTGYEVMGMVGWRKPPPTKSPAEKGSADAKIIDT